MNKKSGKQDPLRTSAEAQLARVPNTKLKPSSAEELLHELQVHQIELEMQNETLRQAQAALEESRDRYVDLYEFAPVGYLTLTDKGMISEINLIGSTLLKVERNKLLHRRFATFVATEDRDRWDRHFLNVLTRDDILTCEVALQHEEGSRIYARLNCLRLKKDGKESVVRVALTDITERKQAEDELKLQRDNFTRILNAMTDGIYVVKRNYDIEYINPVIEREFGKVDGRKCYTYFHDRTEPCPWCKNDEVFKGNTVRWEWHSNKTGKTYDLLDTPIINPDGTVSKFEIFHDITERKQEQAKLVEQVEELRRWNDATMGREIRTIELKHEVNELLAQAGQPPRYPSAENNQLEQ